MSDALTDAANAISNQSPAIKRFAQLSAQRTIALEQRVDALTPTPPPPPSPAPTGVQKPYGVLRLGDSYATATGYDRYGQVCTSIAFADPVAALPATTKRLGYLDYFEIPHDPATGSTYFTGIPFGAEAPYKLAVEIGEYAGTILLDPASPGLADALIANITAFLTQHKLDGFYSDNCVADPHTFELAALPAAYMDVSKWYSATQALVIKVGQALKAKGFYVGANMIAFFPSNVGAFPGTDSNNGSTVAEWIKRCSPGLSWAMVENWMRANGHLRGVTSPISWDNQWDQWQTLVRTTQDVGLDFVPTINVDQAGQAAAVYTQASFLLDKDDGRAGGVMVMGGTEPYSVAWAKPVGKALGPKAKMGNAWTRKFSDGAGGTITVTVDPVARTASIV